MHVSKKKLTDTESYTWEYLNKNFKDIRQLSISELSELINVSNSTITRTLQKKGYSGFIDFKHIMNNRISDELSVLTNEALTDDTRVSVLKSYQEVTRTLNMLDLESLNKAINEMVSSKKITIFARGFSEFIATEMQTKILLLGKYCDLYTDPNIIRPISKKLDFDTFVIFISLNGETKALVDAAINCDQKQIPNLLISANRSGSLTNYTSNQLFVFKTELTYFPDFEVHSRLPIYIVARILLDNLATYLAKNN